MRPVHYMARRFRTLVAAHLLPSEGLSGTSLLHLWDVTATTSLTPTNTAQLQRLIPNPLVRPNTRPSPLPPTVPITAATTAAAPETGYDLYLRITDTPDALSHMRNLAQLYHNYLRDATVTKKITALPSQFPSLVPAVPAYARTLTTCSMQCSGSPYSCKVG